jgi:hypothetical protein
VVRAAMRGIRDVPVTAAQLWRVPLIPWMLAGAWRARKDRTLIPRRGKRIGTRVSIREEAACAWADAGHDRVTIYAEMKIIEKRLLGATEDFLESRDVDSSMFKRLTFSIINNSGFLNMGHLHSNQGAFGQGAQFHNQAGSPSATASCWGTACATKCHAPSRPAVSRMSQPRSGRSCPRRSNASWPLRSSTTIRRRAFPAFLTP